MFKKWFDHVSSHVTVWTWIFGGGVVSAGTITGLLARATGWIAPWGPIGWWTCALLGALLGSAIFAVATKAYAVLLEARLKRRIYGSHDRINPMQTIFDSQRVNLQDLALPFAPKVSRKTFRNCDLLGPCNIIVLGRTDITNCGGSQVQAAIVKSNYPIMNCIALEDCSISNCNLYQITFFIPEDLRQTFQDGNTGGMHFITN